MLDLTEGRPFRALLIFALPVIGGNLFQLFYALGSATVAGYTAATKADQVSVLVNNAMMTAISNYVAQNYGAGKKDRILAVYRTSIQSMQNGTAPFAACMIELVMRLAATIGLTAAIGYMGVCLASPLAWAGACGLLIPVYYRMIRNLHFADT